MKKTFKNKIIWVEWTGNTYLTISQMQLFCQFDKKIKCPFGLYCKQKKTFLEWKKIEEIFENVISTDFEKIWLDLGIKKIIKKEMNTNMANHSIKNDKNYIWEIVKKMIWLKIIQSLFQKKKQI